MLRFLHSSSVVHRSRFLFAVAMLATSLTSYAQADYAREKRWADEITPGIIVGDRVDLQLPSGQRFLAIYTPQSDRAKGVVVVHGMGVHPDWGLINALRTGLAEHGYATLSVQMPVLAASATGERYPPLYPEAAERLRVAVDFLRAQRYRKIAIVSHSLGSRMTDFFLHRDPAVPVDAWVAIGLSGGYSDPAVLRMPVLDVYGDRDLPAVLRASAERAAALRKIRGSAQIEVTAADHFFEGREAELLVQIRQFLDPKLGR
jgi:predicted alpha/beta-hydrolase family hydrolase